MVTTLYHHRGCAESVFLVLTKRKAGSWYKNGVSSVEAVSLSPALLHSCFHHGFSYPAGPSHEKTKALESEDITIFSLVSFVVSLF